MGQQRELLDALVNLQKQIHAHHKMNVKNDFSLMVADAQASKAIANARAETPVEQVAAIAPQMPTTDEILIVVIGLHKALERVQHEYNPDSTESEWLRESNELVCKLTGRSISALDRERKQAFEATGNNAGA